MNESDLHNYQWESIEHIMRHSHSALFLEMGLGKTISTLTAVKKLMYEELDIDKPLIVAPKRVTESVWGDEIEKWSHVRNLKLSKIIGTEKQRKAALQKNADIYIVSRDNIVWLCRQYIKSTWPFDMLIIDESSSFKSHKVQRFIALKALQLLFKRVVILTGTPASNSLMDLWSQIYLLDRGKRLGRYITTYRDNYFRPDKTKDHIIYSYRLKDKDCENKIHAKISDICISMKAEDYLELPERIDNTIEIKFPPELQSNYNEFEKEKVLELFSENTIITAVNAAVLTNKLLQFADGAVYDDDKNVHEIHELKLDALEEIIENVNGQPVLVAWTYRHARDRIMKRLKKYNPRELKTDKDIKDWNRGAIPVMLTHPASGGHGLNLQGGGNIIVWFGQIWSLELYQQLNARILRQGQQAETVIIHHIIVKKTMDPEVIRSQQKKDQNQKALMEAVKARIKEYLK